MKKLLLLSLTLSLTSSAFATYEKAPACLDDKTADELLVQFYQEKREKAEQRKLLAATSATVRRSSSAQNVEKENHQQPKPLAKRASTIPNMKQNAQRSATVYAAATLHGMNYGFVFAHDSIFIQ